MKVTNIRVREDKERMIFNVDTDDANYYTNNKLIHSLVLSAYLNDIQISAIEVETVPGSSKTKNVVELIL